jgi:AmiR/NasT family two-component response regulator
MNQAQILIVEDERIVAADLEDTLVNFGYGVCGRAASGADAIEKAGAHQPDLILMDIKLEGEMSGIEAAAHIQQKWDLPVIYLTAYSDEPLLERATLTGPFGYLLKPFQSRELKASIEMALYKARMEHALKKSNQELKAALEQVKKLSGLLPICCNCKKIRDEKDYWLQVEEYIADHSEAEFSHSICPECMVVLYPELYGGKE